MRRVLEPGRNCSRIAQVCESGVLVDAHDYYLAVHTAVRHARRYVLMAGWQFDSEVPLLRGGDAERAQGPVRLLALLEQAVAERPDLQVYLLAWDYSLVFALEREWMQRLKFGWATNERIHFVFDDQHPMGASHHQKLVVVDGAIAFTGGIDLCDSRWDDRRHALHNPERITLSGDPQKPYHDLMAYCTGPVVADLAQLFGTRWRRATGSDLALPQADGSSPPPIASALPIA
jgi:phosphatidylserine/phosphatidylglycerophosphate/cardiolipin synthase-like enzyme